MLQGVLSQVESLDVNKSRSWQTDWPNNNTPNTGNLGTLLCALKLCCFHTKKKTRLDVIIILQQFEIVHHAPSDTSM